VVFLRYGDAIERLVCSGSNFYIYFSVDGIWDENGSSVRSRESRISNKKRKQYNCKNLNIYNNIYKVNKYFYKSWVHCQI